MEKGEMEKGQGSRRKMTGKYKLLFVLLWMGVVLIERAVCDPGVINLKTLKYAKNKQRERERGRGSGSLSHLAIQFTDFQWATPLHCSTLSTTPHYCLAGLREFLSYFLIHATKNISQVIVCAYLPDILLFAGCLIWVSSKKLLRNKKTRLFRLKPSITSCYWVTLQGKKNNNNYQPIFNTTTKLNKCTSHIRLRPPSEVRSSPILGIWNVTITNILTVLIRLPSPNISYTIWAFLKNHTKPLHSRYHMLIILLLYLMMVLLGSY